MISENTSISYLSNLIKTWKVYEPVPEEIKKSQVDEAITTLKAKLVPASDSDFADNMAYLFDFIKAFKIDENPFTAVKLYRKALDEIPGDLLQKAVMQTCRNWKYLHKIPLPADIVGYIGDELSERRFLLKRLEMLKQKVALEDKMYGKMI